MNIHVQHGLPFVSVTLIFKGKQLRMDKVLLDTGSAGTLFNADWVRDIGVVPEGNDIVDTIRGVGGVEIGSMDYGMDIDGIIGFDFMVAAGLVIDTKLMTVKSV